MKTHTLRIVALAFTAGAFLQSTIPSFAADAESRQAADARAKDPAWKPTAQEVGAIQLGDAKSPGALKNFCINGEGNILACFGPNERRKSTASPSVRVYSPVGKLLKTLPIEISAEAICTVKDGSIFVAGDGRLLKLDAEGKVVASAESPVASAPVEISKETEESLKRANRFNPAEIERKKASLALRRKQITGMAATDRDVFITVPSPSDHTFRVYRFDHSLQNPKLVVEKLRGCCGQMDLQAHGDKIWIPHNGRHSVEARDRDGKEVFKFGKGGKVKAEDFGGCCEPKNMRVLASGDILVAESGPPLCIKRFSAAGKFLDVVALVPGDSDCLRVTVEASPDGRSFYMLDTTRDAIRVFKAKG